MYVDSGSRSVFFKPWGHGPTWRRLEFKWGGCLKCLLIDKNIYIYIAQIGLQAAKKVGNHWSK